MQQLDGTILIQARMLPQVVATCMLPCTTEHRYPNSREVAELLSFLGLLCLAPSLRFDSTVPKDTLAQLSEAAGLLGLAEHVSPLKAPTPAQMIDDARNALAFCSGAMMRSADQANFSAGRVRLKDSVVTSFGNTLRAICDARTPEARVAIALEGVDVNFNGAKCG